MRNHPITSLPSCDLFSSFQVWSFFLEKMNSDIAALPATLKLDFPDGDIPKSKAESYKPTYSNEFRVLAKVVEDCDDPPVKALLEDTFKSHTTDATPNFGPFRVGFRPGICGALKDTVISVLPHTFRKCLGGFCILEEKSPTLGSVLGKSAWSFGTNVASIVFPLFVLSIVDLIYHPRDFLLKACNEMAYGSSLVLNASSPCDSIPVQIYQESEKISSHPAQVFWLDYEENCTGVASQITKEDNSVMDRSYILKYFIFGAVLAIAFCLAKMEFDEVRLVRVSLSQGGIYLPSAGKSNFTIMRYKVYFIVDAIIIVYLCTVFGETISSAQQDWYVYPTKTESFEAWMDAKSDGTFYDGHRDGNTFTYKTNYGFCSALTRPLKLKYVWESDSNWIMVALETFLFIEMCYSMISTQSQLYNWIDQDQLMDEDCKDTCPYYNIVEKRTRVFVEPMLHDWMTINLYYPICRTILTDEKYISTKEKWDSNEVVSKVEAALKEIHKKHSGSSELAESHYEMHIRGVNV